MAIQQQVKPTRMELIRLKKRTKLAQKGHKLLKDKRDGLMREFMKIIRRAHSLRLQADALFEAAQRQFILAEASMQPVAVLVIQRLALYTIELSVRERHVLGAHLPDFDVQLKKTQAAYPAWETSAELDMALRTFHQVLPLLLEVAVVEKSASLLAKEIEKTRRRVNALEHVLIPQLQHLVKRIQIRLDEQERAATLTAMIVKRQLAAEPYS